MRKILAAGILGSAANCLLSDVSVTGGALCK